MNIAVCGARGRTGSRIAEELLRRGHSVVALVRNRDAGERANMTVVVDDLSDAGRTAANLAGVDALVSAYAPPPDAQMELVAVTQRLVDAASRSGLPRLLVVGGAGTLTVAPGVTLLDSGKLPPDWQGIARAHAAMLAMLEQAPVDWTYFAPAAYFDPGERTGKFRLGTNALIAQPDGQSRISMEDYAIAMADEIEHPQHRRGRMTIGY